MGGMVTTSRSELWGAMWTFQDHGSTHEAEFGRERPPGYRWLPHIQPSPVMNTAGLHRDGKHRASDAVQCPYVLLLAGLHGPSPASLLPVAQGEPH